VVEHNRDVVCRGRCCSTIFWGFPICFFTDLGVASLPGLHAFGTIPMIRPIALGG